MDRYTGNAIYDFLRKNTPQGRYLWSAKDSWMLLYADYDEVPKIIAIIKEVDSVSEGLQPDSNGISYEQRHALAKLADKCKLPLFIIAFSHQAGSIQFAFTERRVGANSAPAMRVITSDDLCAKFRESGLTVASKSVKEINDKSSSSFHDWQRNNLGSSTIAVDFDLFKNESGEPRVLFELKRSKTDFEKWKPYSDDYPNYRLQSKFAQAAGLDYYIVFNHFTEDSSGEKHDDISRLKVYTVKDPNVPRIEYAYIKTPDSFFY